MNDKLQESTVDNLSVVREFASELIERYKEYNKPVIAFSGVGRQLRTIWDDKGSLANTPEMFKVLNYALKDAGYVCSWRDNPNGLGVLFFIFKQGYSVTENIPLICVSTQDDADSLCISVSCASNDITIIPTCECGIPT